MKKGPGPIKTQRKTVVASLLLSHSLSYTRAYVAHTHTHMKTIQMDCLTVNSSSPTRLSEMHLPLPADHFPERYPDADF